MKLTVLVDNNTYIDNYFLAEPGLSFFIEDQDTRLLFDCGYSHIFFENARKMGIDLLFLDYLVFSHCHMDHTWGVDTLIREYTNAILQNHLHKKPELVAHPKAFISTVIDGVGEIGSIISEEKLKQQFKLSLSSVPVHLTDRLVYLGEIPRKFSFESHHPLGRKEGETQDDFVIDDTALAYKSEDGLVIITGCSHAGICNILEYARRVCRDDRIVDIIGGLHLLNPPKEQMQGTLDYLKGLGLKKLHACHCTDFDSKVCLTAVAPVKEVGVGLCLEYR
ncbi:MAG: MBL fold metallo-hydrolase [Desulfobacterales bacterium]|nr:MBL fold metallo-hydrolase [Desulfobacterales bacterium]MDD4072269.1 MBL fold metallo-hydrolase [Desulfobacterales bacterium]MDD4392806.1 MBL fold metallo-hydrolase [Desulfobacterales bacterium]